MSEAGAAYVVAVAVFESEEQLERALTSVADFVRRVAPLSERAPERRWGDVLYHAVG